MTLSRRAERKRSEKRRTLRVQFSSKTSTLIFGILTVEGHTDKSFHPKQEQRMAGWNKSKCERVTVGLRWGSIFIDQLDDSSQSGYLLLFDPSVVLSQSTFNVVRSEWQKPRSKQNKQCYLKSKVYLQKHRTWVI